MRSPEEKEKLITRLQEDIKRGNMIVIAVDRFLGDHMKTRKVALDSQLLQLFRDGEHGSKLISVVAELSALDNMESDILHKLNAAKGAEKTLNSII